MVDFGKLKAQQVEPLSIFGAIVVFLHDLDLRHMNHRLLLGSDDLLRLAGHAPAERDLL